MSTLDDVGDRVAILDLYSRYCFAIDSSDAGAFGDCFLPDGVFDVVDRGTFAGRDAIQNMIIAVDPGSGSAGSNAPARNSTANIATIITGEPASTATESRLCSRSDSIRVTWLKGMARS